MLNNLRRRIPSRDSVTIGFQDPRDIVEGIHRIVYLSVESTQIIDALPAEIMTTEA